MRLILRLIFAVWAAESSAEDAAFGGVSKGALGAAVLLPAAWAALRGLPGSRYVLWDCAAAMGCFAGASHITRIIRRAHTSTLGDADVLAAGVVALFTGPLWTIAAAAASALCGVYCMAAGKHRAPFIPFLNVAAVITVALADGNLIASHGGLLYD